MEDVSFALEVCILYDFTNRAHSKGLEKGMDRGFAMWACFSRHKAASRMTIWTSSLSYWIFSLAV